MVSQTNEQALEAAIEKHLTGTCLEETQAKGMTSEVHEPDVPFGEHHGYTLGFTADFNAQYALNEKTILGIMEGQA